MRGRIVQNVLKAAAMASVLALYTGCSGSQQEDENLEATDENGDKSNENLGQDDAAEGNGQENYVDNNEGKDNAQGAATNSATEQLDSTLDNQGATPPVNTAATNTATPPAPPPAAAGGEGSPVPGGRVRYVKAGGVQAVNAPGGQPVMMIEQGEHPVTWEENGYLKIANGVYVPVDAMSDKGIARPTTAGGWAH